MKKIVLAFTLMLSSLGTADLPKNYLSLSAEEKKKVLWRNVDKGEYEFLLPTDYYWPIRTAGILLRASMMHDTFLHSSDEAPVDEDGIRKIKAIHQYGSVAPFEYLPNENAAAFSGIFSDRSIGLLRLGLALEYDEDGGSYTPGMAVKFLVSGRESVNLHVMHSLDGQGSNTNIFLHDFTNVLPEPKTFPALAAWAFRKALEEVKDILREKNPKQPLESEAIRLSINHLAKVTSDGKDVPKDQVREAFQVIFRPLISDDKGSVDPRGFLELKVPYGAEIYEVLLKEKPDSVEVSVGKIKLLDTFVNSRYGDEILWFQHNAE
jgi:hypothetical protein